MQFCVPGYFVLFGGGGGMVMVPLVVLPLAFVLR